MLTEEALGSGGDSGLATTHGPGASGVSEAAIAAIPSTSSAAVAQEPVPAEAAAEAAAATMEESDFLGVAMCGGRWQAGFSLRLDAAAGRPCRQAHPQAQQLQAGSELGEWRAAKKQGWREAGRHPTSRDCRACQPQPRRAALRRRLASQSQPQPHCLLSGLHCLLVHSPTPSCLRRPAPTSPCGLCHARPPSPATHPQLLNHQPPPCAPLCRSRAAERPCCAVARPLECP